jgi:hypothetical protein
VARRLALRRVRTAQRAARGRRVKCIWRSVTAQRFGCVRICTLSAKIYTTYGRQQHWRKAFHESVTRTWKPV